MMIGGERRCRQASRSDLPTLAPGIGDIATHAGPREARRHRRAGLPALRPQRRRPLRQDGPQRHRVRHHGRLCRRAGHPAPRQRRQAERTRSTPRPRRCAIPNITSTISILRDIAEVWRRGSVIASWLLDLTATALVEDPELSQISPAASRIRAKGAGRSRPPSTKAVPAPVLTAALYERFSSRGEADFQDKLLSAMRFEFGGHLEKPASNEDGDV